MTVTLANGLTAKQLQLIKQSNNSWLCNKKIVGYKITDCMTLAVGDIVFELIKVGNRYATVGDINDNQMISCDITTQSNSINMIGIRIIIYNV
jgi:hypothetical protein